MKRLIGIAVVAALVASLSGACTTHGEGGRCDFLNNANADCDNGLKCYPAGEIHLPEGGTQSQTDICCPLDRTTVPVGDICALNPTTPGSDAGIPDGGFETGTTDATADQSSGDASDAQSDVVTTDASDASGD